MMENCQMQAWRISIDRNIIEFYNGLSTVVRSFTLEDMRKIFVNQDDDFVRALDDPYKALDHPLIYVGQMYPRVSQSSTELQWVQINSIPEFDKNGRLLGSFGIWRNINDIMQKQEQLKRETERANDSGHQKSVFLANMTHEIRTPLNAIVGFSDLLQAIDSPEEKREMIRIIHNNCDMLLRLVNDILVLSNVDANAMQMRPEQIDFVAEFNDICKSLAERVQEPTVQFQSESPCETASSRSSPTSLPMPSSTPIRATSVWATVLWSAKVAKVSTSIARTRVQAFLKTSSVASSNALSNSTITSRARGSASPSARPSSTSVRAR